MKVGTRVNTKSFDGSPAKARVSPGVWAVDEGEIVAHNVAKGYVTVEWTIRGRSAHHVSELMAVAS